MKRIFIAVVIIIALLLAGIYWFIPNPLTVSIIVTLPSNAAAANRALLQKENWKTFWVGEKKLTTSTSLSSNDLFLYNEDTFRITNLLQNSLAIAIFNGILHEKSILMIIPIQRDSIVLNWTYSTIASANPFTRVQQYQQAVTTKKNMDAALQKIKHFLSAAQNVYGISIAQTTTSDTTLVSTYSIINNYPATEDIYGLIEKLQTYINENKALQTGSPLLNITPLGKQQYKIMVALPTNKQLDEKGDITYKKMIPGRFLTTTVSGGNGAVNNAYTQMQQYFQDYQRIAMAIPFQVLVTDRSKQTDTTKWITKLYFPVM